MLASRHMRKMLLGAVIVCVATDISADVWSRSFTPSTPGSVTALAQVRDGSVVVIENTFGGPCIASLHGETAGAECIGAGNHADGGRIALGTDGYFIYGSSYRPNESIKTGFVFRVDAAGKVKWARRYVYSDH